MVTGLVMKGRQAQGVRFQQGGARHEVQGRREVILCAGALQSPQLLQLAGIADPALLARHGIPLLHALPGVGENLQDTPAGALDLRMHQAHHHQRPAQFAVGTCGHRAAMACSSARGRWPWASTRAAAFMRALPQSSRPRHPVPRGHAGRLIQQAARCTRSAVSRSRCVPAAAAQPLGACRSPAATRPMRRRCSPTTWTAKSTAAPWWRACVPRARWPRRRPCSPTSGARCGPGPTRAATTNCWISRANHGATIFHPSGTCQMGSGPLAVVDGRSAREHGIGRLCAWWTAR